MDSSFNAARSPPAAQALDKALVQYNELLARRAANIRAVEHEKNVGSELKALLNKYLSARVRGSAAREGRTSFSFRASRSAGGTHAQVNEDLIHPPSQTIRLDEYKSFQGTADHFGGPQ